MAGSVDIRSIDGTVVGSVVLDQAIFGIEPNVAVMHQVVTAQLAAARAGTQSTKTRAEVRGGGRKPFRQKGTGRARQGSTRAPHWVGGGVALGPKPRSYKQRTPRKMIQLALRSALSDRAAEGRIAVVAEWPWTEPKTARARESLVALELTGKTLIVLDRSADEQAAKSFRNLQDAQVLFSGELNAYDVLCNDWIVFSRGTLPGDSVEGDEGHDATVDEVSDAVVEDEDSDAVATAPVVTPASDDRASDDRASDAADTAEEAQ